MKKESRNRLVQSSSEYFDAKTRNSLFIPPEIAEEVCKKALQNDLIIFRIEGGIWHGPGFEARLDCIWDGQMPQVSSADADKNNREALEFIRSEKLMHNAFVLASK